MRLPQSGSPRMAKSTSAGTIECEPGSLHIVDQDDIIGLTQDVKNFSDGLARLKAVFNEPFADADADEDMRVLAHEQLGEVLCSLKSVLQQYPPLNSTELFSAAGTLISKIKSYNYEERAGEKVEQGFNDAIDQLALEFSSSVSEYLMGDMQHGVYEDEGKTKSYDNLLSVSQDVSDKDEAELEKEESVVHLTVEQIDLTLMNLQAGLDLAFQRVKAWSRYLKDVMSYIERRAQLEVEYSKNLSRLAVSMKPALTEEGFLPLQSVYCTVLSQDVEYSKTCQATFTLLQTSKFVEPLTARRTEHDKTRKALKDTWVKEVKKMQDTVANLRKAQTLYTTRQQDYEKAKDLAQRTESDMLSLSSGGSSNLTAKVDKKKKQEEDAMHKAAETETTYKACVAEANSRQQELLRIKSELLAAIREQIYLSDQAIKKVTVDYFQLLQTVSAPVPVQYHTLCEASKRYSAGSQYGEFVRRLPVSSSPSPSQQYDEFKFEPYYGSKQGEMQNRKISTQSNESASSDHLSADGSPGLTPRRDKYRVPVKAWGQQGFTLGSDTDSQSGSSKSLDSSPSSSPHPLGHKKRALAGSMDDLIEVPTGVKQLLSIPGTETSQLDGQAITRRHPRRRNTTFGVDFQEQVEHYHTAVPPIITKCLKEVERKGIYVKGIYRVSGVKSTVETVCQRVEMDPESVDLTSENPNVISNVLKLYLRQLPEPLLTFRLYPCFIQIAKDHNTPGVSREDTVEKLHDLVDSLPFSNRKTCGVLMHHLQRVAAHADQNHMNASNLGIVFGPTLLRPQGGHASLASLVDTPHQTRVVEMLIVSAQSLFGPDLDHQVTPGQTPVQPLGTDATLTVPQATIEAPPKEPELKKGILASPSEKMPDHIAGRLVHPHVTPATGRADTTQPKSSEEAITLPGYTNLDKKSSSIKGVQPTLQTSDGEDDCIDLDDSAELESDDDLPESLLPDDSLLSQNSLLITGNRVLRYKEGSHLTPPLTTRHITKPLSSPASSPNLPAKMGLYPPLIVTDDSVQIAPPATQEPPCSQQPRQQLPPINTLVPKGESIFDEIFDSRSPQVYRRLTTSAGKTASYPQAQQSSSSNQAARVSWPQGSQPQTAQSDNVLESKDDNALNPVDKYDITQTQFVKSPRVLRKCSSFDQERSKPFPTRSVIKSPMLLHKGGSLDGTDIAPLAITKRKDDESKTLLESPTTSVESADFGKKAETEISLSDRKLDKLIIHRGSYDECSDLDVPICSSESSSITRFEFGIDVSTGSTDLKEMLDRVDETDDEQPITGTSQLLDLRETDILDDVVPDDTPSRPEKEEKIVDVATKIKEKQTSNVEVDEKASICSIESGRPSLPRTVPSPGVGLTKTKQKKLVTKSHSGPIMGKAGLKPVKKESFLSNKSGTKSTTSSVRSALLTSAAKLKSIGRKSPVQLLSYKSEAISIPEKRVRPWSAPIPGPSGSEAGKSPAKSTSSSQENPKGKGKSPLVKGGESTSKSKKSVQKSVAKTVSTPQPVMLSVQGMRKSSLGSSTVHSVCLPDRSVLEAKKKSKEKSLSFGKSSSKVKTSEKQSNKDRRTSQASSVASSAASQSSETKSDSSDKYRRQEEARPKATKRDSITSQSSRRSDQCQHCCHGSYCTHKRKKPPDKK